MIGKKISRYVIEAKLGEGSRGPVWLAADDMLGRKVALRVLDPSESPETGARLLEEARLASTLKHPGINLLFDAGVHEDRAFIVLQYVEGKTVAEILGRRRFDEQEAIRLGVRIAEALQHAHERGILHRNIHSRNILVDSGGQGVLMDFGFAVSLDRRRSVTVPLRDEAFVAPEVRRGEAETAASEVYSLGVVLLEMVTGRRSPDHPGGTELSPDLEAVLRAAIHPDPARRIPSAGELARRLFPLLDEPEPIRTGGTRDTAPSPAGWMRSWKTAAPVLLVASLVVVLANRETIRNLIPGRSDERRARARLLYEQGEEAWEDPSHPGTRALDLFRQATTLDPDLAEAHLGIGAAILANLYYGWSAGPDVYHEAEQSFRRAMEIDPDLIQARRGLMRILGWQGRCREVLEQGRELWSRGDRNYQVMMAMADAFWDGGLVEESIPFLEEALRMDPGSQEALYHLAYRLVQANRLEEGIEAGNRYGERYGTNPDVEVWMGIAYRALGDLESARLHFDRALEGTGATTSNHYIFPEAAQCYLDLRLVDGAHDILERGLVIMEPRVVSVPDNDNLWLQLLESYVLLGRRDEALRKLSSLDDETRARVLSPLLMSREEFAARMTEEFRRGRISSRGFNIVPHPSIPDLHTAPVYREMLAEYRRLRTRLRDTYADIGLIREYRARDLYEEGTALLQEEMDIESLRRARDLMLTVIELDPDFVDAHIGLGAAYRAGVHYGWFDGSALDSARAAFERALEMNPMNQQALTGLLRVHFSAENAEACLEIADRVRRSGRSDVSALITRTWGYAMAGFAEEAMPMLEQVLREDPGHQEARFIEFILSVLAGEYERAVRAGKAYVDRYGEDGEAEFWTAVACHALGRLQEAREHYDRAMEFYGTNTNHYVPVWAGLCYEQLGLVEEARIIWREAVSGIRNRLGLIPDSPLLREYLAADLVLLGEAGATDLEVSPRGYRGFYLVAACELRGRREEAIRILEALEIGPSFQRICTTLFGIPDLAGIPAFHAPLRRLEARRDSLRQRYGLH